MADILTNEVGFFFFICSRSRGVITEGSQWRPLKAVEVTEDPFSLFYLSENVILCTFGEIVAC